MAKYRYDSIGAFYAKDNRHPQVVIREVAPLASKLEAHAFADCWLFDAPEIANPPEFIVRIDDGGNTVEP